MKFLTIRQPWASLIAVGAKTIETRPFSTTYRGPLAIHAGKARPTFHSLPGFTDVTGEPISEGHDLAWLDLSKWPGPDFVYDVGRSLVPLPLGAVVAVCDLVDVVPIVDDYEVMCSAYEGRAAVERTPNDHLIAYPDWGGALDEDDERDVTDQFPFGDFTPGRYAWLLDNVRSIDPVPMKGAQGLRDLPDDVWPPHMWKEAK